MSVRAYRIKEIITERTDSFNLWYDEDLMTFLNSEGFYEHLNSEGCGLTYIPLEIMEHAVETRNVDEYTIKKIQKDIETVKAKGEDYIEYYCY